MAQPESDRLIAALDRALSQTDADDDAVMVPRWVVDDTANHIELLRKENTGLKAEIELIVQKCITQIALIGVSNFENEDIMWTVETAIVSIKEHFGVEE